MAETKYSALPPLVEGVQDKKSKKFVVGEEDLASVLPPPTTGIAIKRQQSHRHHVKRRSGGRVHVTKLAPMTRASHAATTSTTTGAGGGALTDTEADFDHRQKKKQQQQPPPMRRTQSQRSLHRLDKKMLSLSTANITEETSPSSDNINQQQAARESDRTATAQQQGDRSHPKNWLVSHQKRALLAAPIEQTFNAVAKNLVIPADRTAMHQAAAAVAGVVSTHSDSNSNNVNRRIPLRSHFITDEPHEQERNDDDDDELARELSRMNREYAYVKQYRDPMTESFLRCMVQKSQNQSRASISRAYSTSVVPTLSQEHSPHLHAAQREAAHRHHRHVKASGHHHPSTIPHTYAVHSSSSSSGGGSPSSSSSSTGPLWRAANSFLGRMLHGMRNPQ